MSPASRFAFADILAVLDALPVGMLMASPQGEVLHVNPALSSMTGFASQQAKGMPCRHVLRGRPCIAGCSLGCGSWGSAGSPLAGGMDSRFEGIKDFAGSLISKGIETDILTLKKRRMPVRLTHFPVPDASGKELFRLDVVEDLTEIRLLEQRLHQASGHGKFVGRSAAMERVISLIPGIAPSSVPVFITGETGTGKDILAETLHQSSQRSREPFIRVNVTPLPEALLAQEIFGQAHSDSPERPGRFQQASGGTLYITEVADMPKGIQARLVDFLDTGSIVPVGSFREIRLDVRLITATNRNPEELMDRGLLSRELFHRLNVAHLSLPPLRERKEDIDFLLRHFLDTFAARFKKSFNGFTPEACALLAAYDYPGNVRELKNIVEYAAMVCSEAMIGTDSLPAHMTQASGPAVGGVAVDGKRSSSRGGKNGGRE